jgi:tRNA N6-adenosine threonylcarbamoyltransferase
MRILGIESSCDETAAALVEDGTRVLSSIVASQTELHQEYAGVVPELASRAHVERILPTVREALAQAGVGLGWIDAVAVGHRPGLIGSLLVGVGAAKALSWSLGKPLIGVDHIHAHLYSGMLEDVGCGMSDVGAGQESWLGGPTHSPRPGTDTRHPTSDIFPALGLVVSGGHTSLYRVDSWTSLTRLGATIDDAVGEAFDKAATILGLPYPGGPNLDRLASTPGANENAVPLPISRIDPGSLDFSFSGLKTALLYAAKGVPGRRDAPPVPELTEQRKADLAASFQKAAVDAVMLKLRRAIGQFPKPASGQRRTVLTGGGVTANSRLRRELQSWAGGEDLDLRLPARAYCMDNAAMIAGLARELHKAGRTSDLSLQAVPTTAA